MKNSSIKQLVIVCRDFAIDWQQFINPLFVGIETGILTLLKNKKDISFICGDNDTISKQKLKLVLKKSKILKIDNIIFNVEKDFLDSELAIIEALQRQLDFQQIVLVADGSRWDMLLANINILKKYVQFNPILLGENNYCMLLTAGTEYIFQEWQLTYNYISLFTLDKEPVIYNFRGCKFYPNQDITINSNDTQAISNQFVEDITQEPKLTIIKGRCLVFLYKK